MPAKVPMPAPRPVTKRKKLAPSQSKNETSPLLTQLTQNVAPGGPAPPRSSDSYSKVSSSVTHIDLPTAVDDSHRKRPTSEGKAPARLTKAVPIGLPISSVAPVSSTLSSNTGGLASSLLGVGVKSTSLGVARSSSSKPGVNIGLPLSSSLPSSAQALIRQNKQQQEQQQGVGSSCPKCNSMNIDQDEASGNAVCMACGTVIEENSIVASVQFAESSSGTSSIVGQYVSATATKSFSSGMAVHGITYTKESREITINNGRKRISQLAAKLRLGQHYVDSAHRLFLLAVQRNFVQGRRTTHVVAACLYIVCRTEKSPYLLIDFSDALQVNVYELGTCFLKFCRLLNLTLPLIEPTLYIHRFSSKLEFGGGEKTHQVAMTALRLVKRFKKDWIQTGRRPAGICAAALFIASGMHGFKRTQRDIISVTRICDQTLRNRLVEFAATPTARLTPGQFQEIDLPEECDPPSFTRNRERERLALEMGRGDVALLKNSGHGSEETNSGKKKRQKTIEREEEFAKMYDMLGSEVDKWEEEIEQETESEGTLPVPVYESPASAGLASSVLQVHDEEMKEYMCSASEVQTKTELWNRLNKGYLEEQAQKRSLNANQRPKKRKKKQEKNSRTVYRTAADAAYQTTIKKTKKIDYEAMQSLFQQDDKPGRDDSKAEAGRSMNEKKIVGKTAKV